MAIKYCSSCGNEIDEESAFCPKCGAKQTAGSGFQSEKNESEYRYHVESKSDGISINKVLSIVALALSIVSIVFGGLLAEVVAVIISIIVIKSKDRCEPEAKTMSKIALIIGIVLIVVRTVVLVFLGGALLSIYGYVFDSIGNML